MNRAIVMGRLGRDPEQKSLQNGTTLTTFSLATNERWRKDGERQERTDWHRCEAWGPLGDLIAKNCRKGHQILVEGRIRVDQVEKDGEKKTFNKILVDRMEFAFDRPGREQDDSGQDYSDVPF